MRDSMITKIAMTCGIVAVAWLVQPSQADGPAALGTEQVKALAFDPFGLVTGAVALVQAARNALVARAIAPVTGGGSDGGLVRVQAVVLVPDPSQYRSGYRAPRRET